MKNKGDYSVKIKFGDVEVDVQGAESGVVKIVDALADVLGSSRKAAVSAPVMFGSGTPPIKTSTHRSGSVDIRSFFEQKQPSSDIEAAAAATYYYQFLAPEAERRETIDAGALQEAFRLARRRLPAKAIYTLINARNAGYLDSGEGGQFRLNPVGYNLVEHSLGSSESTEKRKARKRKRKQKGRRTLK